MSLYSETFHISFKEDFCVFRILVGELSSIEVLLSTRHFCLGSLQRANLRLSCVTQMLGNCPCVHRLGQCWRRTHCSSLTLLLLDKEQTKNPQAVCIFSWTYPGIGIIACIPYIALGQLCSAHSRITMYQTVIFYFIALFSLLLKIPLILGNISRFSPQAPLSPMFSNAEQFSFF